MHYNLQRKDCRDCFGEMRRIARLEHTTDAIIIGVSQKQRMKGVAVHLGDRFGQRLVSEDENTRMPTRDFVGLPRQAVWRRRAVRRRLRRPA